MRHAPWSFIIASFLWFFGNGQQSTCPCPSAPLEPFALSIVRGALNLAEKGVFLDNYMKIIPPMGDTASVAILKLVDRKELLKPEMTKACLFVVLTAFSAPNLISRDIDKDPKVTLFLLSYLHDKEVDKELEKQIEDTEVYVKTKTGSSTQ
jgi:hypothetical protein